MRQRAPANINERCTVHEKTTHLIGLYWQTISLNSRTEKLRKLLIRTIRDWAYWVKTGVMVVRVVENYCVWTEKDLEGGEKESRWEWCTALLFLTQFTILFMAFAKSMGVLILTSIDQTSCAKLFKNVVYHLKGLHSSFKFCILQ